MKHSGPGGGGSLRATPERSTGPPADPRVARGPIRRCACTAPRPLVHTGACDALRRTSPVRGPHPHGLHGPSRLERRLSPNTVAAYRRDLTQLSLSSSANGSSLGTVTYPLLRRFLAQQHTLGYARASVARRVGAIHTFYRWAVATGRLTDDPSLLLGRPKVVNRLPTVLRPAEAAALAEAPRRRGSRRRPARSMPVALRDRAVLELLYGSGLRVGEVATLTLDRIDLDRGRVLVMGKGSKEREVPMSDDCVAALDAYLKAGRSAHVSGKRPRTLLQQAEETLQPTRYPYDGGTICRPVAAGAAGQPAHPAAFVRYASVGRGSRHPSGTGASWARERRDDAALHPCIPGAALPGLRAVPPEGLSVATTKKPATKTATKPAPRRQGEDQGQGRRGRRLHGDGHDPAARRRRARRSLARVQDLGRRRVAREADPALRPAREVRRLPCRDRICPPPSSRPTWSATACSA